jgi:hypothetical protein
VKQPSKQPSKQARREQPLHRLVAVDDVPPDGLDVTVEANAEEREALALLLGLQAVHALTGRFSVKGSPRRLSVVGLVEARVRQVCVVTLDAFDAEVNESVDIMFAEPRPAAADVAHPHTELSLERDLPDDIVEGKIDLGALTAEFLALGLDPYPRKPGVSFSYESQEQPEASPFAALGRLKTNLSGKH